MKLTTSTKEQGKGKWGQGENLATRTARLATLIKLWLGILWEVTAANGKPLLATPIDAKGKTLAEGMAEGKTYTVDAVTIDGRDYPVKPAVVFDMAHCGRGDLVPGGWACPSCGSAHGTGVGVSGNGGGEPDSFHMARDNRFFYSPATKSLFTISKTCWKSYFQGKVLLTKPGVTKPEPKPKPVVKQLPAPKLKDHPQAERVLIDAPAPAPAANGGTTVA